MAAGTVVAAGLTEEETIQVGEDDNALLFRIDDDLFGDVDSGGFEASERPGDSAAQRALWTGAGLEPPLPAIEQPAMGSRIPAAVEAVIDRDEEVPERYWAPEVAGLGRRAMAFLIDQALLLTALGIFFLDAFLALQLNDFDTDVFLAASGLQASLLPFALLAAGLSLAFCVYFHRFWGRTPGKALVGIEVRTSAGGTLSCGRAILRWFGAALGVACAGAGVLWALFEPRRRGWADLASGTVVARTQRSHPRADANR